MGRNYRDPLKIRGVSRVLTGQRVGRPPDLEHPHVDQMLQPYRYWIQGESIAFPSSPKIRARLEALEPLLAEVGLTLHRQYGIDDLDLPKRRRTAQRNVPLADVAWTIFDNPGCTAGELIEKLYRYDSKIEWTDVTRSAAVTRLNVAINRLNRMMPRLVSKSWDSDNPGNRYRIKSEDEKRLDAAGFSGARDEAILSGEEISLDAAPET